MDNENLANEVERWKRIAAYLADCHAANLHEAQLKSCSRARRDRYRRIMETAVDLLSGAQMPQRLHHYTADEQVARVVERLRDHAEKVCD